MARGATLRLALLAVLGGAFPVAAQPAATDAAGWERAADRYLEGDRTGAGTTLLKTAPTDLTRAATGAYERWRLPSGADDDARRAVIARLQASAVLPVDVLLAGRGRTLSVDHERALEDVSRDAWRRLAAFEDERGGQHAERVRRFRLCWRLAMLQHALASGQFAQVTRDANALRLPDEMAEARAAHALLRGVAIETRARLADEAPTGSSAAAMRRVPQSPRLSPMLVAMDEAGAAYRRALDLVPGDRELTLRLARVALERQRLDDVERQLTPLLQPACRETTCGLAHLFMGEVHEARRNLDLAAGAYARASSVPAVRPAALIAMVQTSLRRGNPSGAYELTRQFASPAMLVPGQTPDAWSDYVSGRLIEGDRIISRLFAEIAK